MNGRHVAALSLPAHRLFEGIDHLRKMPASQ
jgi:hypothetical protein